MSELWRWKVPAIKLDGIIMVPFKLLELFDIPLDGRRSSGPRKRRRRPLRRVRW